MDLKKRFNSFVYHLSNLQKGRAVIVGFAFLLLQNVCLTQDSLWTKEEWKEAKKGYVYKDTQVKEEQTEVLDQEFVESDDWNIELSDTARMAILVCFIILLIAVLIYLFWQAGSRDARVKQMDLNMSELELNLDKINPDQFMSQVLDASDYKTAVRLLFLSTLRQLHMINWINWKKDKTNYDFLREMRTRDQYKAFRDLTLAFEIVWYGDTSINEEQYLRIKEKFDSLIQTLPNEK